MSECELLDYFMRQEDVFFLNYVDGELTENVIAGLVCNGNVSASADTGWKVCLWNIWLSRYCISIPRTKLQGKGK